MARYIHSVSKYLYGWAKPLLDTLFPRTRDASMVESIDVEQFRLRAKTASPLGDSIHALFSYRDPLVQALVRELKFRRNKRLADIAATLLSETLLLDLADHHLFEGGIDTLLIPVPVSAGTLARRGFSQCALIVERLDVQLHECDLIVRTDLVEKIRETVPQSRTRSKQERNENVAGCFRVSEKSAIEGRRVIVFDDVITTGATFSEMKRVLCDAGARDVRGLFFAH